MQTRPLLGMSFLSEFQFDLDTAKSELKLVKVEAEDSEQSSGKLKKKGR
jgi:hypothetical protein